MSEVVGRRASLGGFFRWLRRRVRLLSLVGGVLVALGLVLVVVSVEITSTPTFCGTCHIMKPYYESWKISGHNKVACVECHISPGVTAEIRKKYEALSMVAKYFTATYGTKPWAEVDDAACLRCHERRLLEGKEMYKGVRFDHTPHLIEMKRGKKLRCTSCHSQIVQGAHVAVTSTTCVLCHFKGMVPGEGSSRCTICHDVPEKEFVSAGMTFKHADVRQYGMQCTWCHLNASTGDGVVPRERCLTCHNELDRLSRYGEDVFLHEKHVTEHKVDCLNCHLEIQHGGAVARQSNVPACGTCHVSGHSAQQQLYSGTGGRRVPDVPSAMYVAGVRCEGCHTLRRGIVDYANSVSCMTCHGAKYLKIYEGWQRILEERQTEARAVLAAGRANLSSSDPSLQDAVHNINLVESGHGIHNVPYSLVLLDGAADAVNAALKAKGLPVRESKRAEYQKTPCYGCHQGVELQEGTFGGSAFSHQRHLVKAGLTCGTCHRPHEERPRNEIVRFGAQGCIGCHHKLEGADATACRRCHEPAALPPELDYKGRTFVHKFHLEDAGLTCTDCHTLKSDGSVTLNAEACSNCHEG